MSDTINAKEEPKRKRGRPPTVSMTVERDELDAASGRILQVIKSRVRGATRTVGNNKHASNGGYIPISAEYGDKEVFVIVLNEQKRKR